MRHATLYYGFISAEEFVELLQGAGVNNIVASELSKYLQANGKRQIFLDTFYEFI
jgi:hypothetical protein